MEEITQHSRRGAEIRAFLKRATDYFRRIENEYKKWELDEEQSDRAIPYGWGTRRFHAILTHQDESTKVDVPSFIQNASSDITRWRQRI